MTNTGIDEISANIAKQQVIAIAAVYIITAGHCDNNVITTFTMKYFSGSSSHE